MATYTYSIQNDFPNHHVFGSLLAVQAQEAIPGVAFVVNTSGDVCDVVTDVVLTAPQETTLDGVVAAHLGYEITMEMLATANVVGNALAVTSDPTFVDIGGITTNPLFFEPNVNLVFGLMTGQVKTVGTGAELVIDEHFDGQPDSPLNVPPFAVPDTQGEWVTIQFPTNVAPANINQNRVFMLEGRRGGATSFEIRYSSLSLMRTVVLS